MSGSDGTQESAMPRPPIPKLGGLMALPGAELAKAVNYTVLMLRVTNPTWLALYGDNLAAHVQEVLLEGEADARAQVARGEAEGVYGTGGIWIRYDREDGQTTVTVQVVDAWDTPEDET